MTTFRVHYKDLSGIECAGSVLAIADDAQEARDQTMTHLDKRRPDARWKIIKVKFVAPEKTDA